MLDTSLAKISHTFFRIHRMVILMVVSLIIAQPRIYQSHVHTSSMNSEVPILMNDGFFGLPFI